MRRWSFISLCLLAAPLAAQPGTLSARAAAEVKQANGWPSEERGFGVTVKEAKNDAVKHLTEQLATILREHEPSLLLWTPTPEYVKEHLLKGKGEQGPDFVVENIGPAKTWIYKVKGLDWPALMELDRDAQRASRRLNRILMGSQLFGGLCLFLAVAVVSLRQFRCRHSGKKSR